MVFTLLTDCDSGDTSGAETGPINGAINWIIGPTIAPISLPCPSLPYNYLKTS